MVVKSVLYGSGSSKHVDAMNGTQLVDVSRLCGTGVGMPEAFLSMWYPRNAVMSSKCPPVLHLPSVGEQAHRLSVLSQTFIAAFSQQPQFFSRAPGRINKERPSWYNYILCGVRGIKDEGGMQSPFIGLNLAICGNIPPSSGLSSSSALVCASALGMSYAHGLSLALDTLAEICGRYTAKLIEFNPLRATSVALPQGASFVVANSLAPMNKAANSYFNCRVMECRLATQVMAKRAGLPWRTFQKLGDLQQALGKTLPQMISMVEDTFEVRPYSKRQVCELLNTTPEELNQVSLSENTRHIQEFKLHDRALHVFSEAHRVWEFKKVCEEGGPYALLQLGKLMNDSHRSTQLLYECSHPKLDTLVDLSENLALGARLTGAGWGGCMVALVEDSKVEQYKEHLWNNFYSKESAAEGRARESVLFSSHPGPGACVFVK
ncbi:N-acetylgalactosamine kinase [Portunus trituberculatus]|uniref:N-acetylgalactosamine kinase n=1 Tax=Portunus trituberculatus TaxID=210409 RepID=A0A5B7CGZ0_PORTR|nr:N-acetylgalactosamine kinase [Portunus trituberculatus]